MPKGSGSAPARGRRGRGHAALTPPDGAEAEGGSDSSDGGDGGDASGSESGEECEAAVTLESLLAPLSLDEFCRDYWGQKPYATRVERGVFDQLRARFLEGEFGDVAAACRNDDNARCGVRRARAAARRTPHATRRTPHAARCTPHAARCTPASLLSRVAVCSQVHCRGDRRLAGTGGGFTANRVSALLFRARGH